MDAYARVEKNRGRIECRIVKTYNEIEGIDKNWKGIRTLIKVERYVENNKGKIREEEAYYISSLDKNTRAKVFSEGIRGHWSIENSLHYVKDKTFLEDNCKVTADNGAKNLSIIRNIALNLFRKNGFKNIAQAIRLVANDIYKIWGIIE